MYNRRRGAPRARGGGLFPGIGPADHRLAATRSPRPGTDLPPQRAHGRRRRLCAPLRMEVDRYRERVRERARPRRLQGRPDLAARRRSGTDAEFTDMVNRCKAVGVGIIADAVINHMTNHPSPGVGSNGTSYSKYSYPGLYSASDF